MIQLSKPPKNKPGIYNTDLTAGSLKLPESRIVADLLLRNVGPEEWKQAIYSENVLQSKTPETSRRLANLIRSCRAVSPFQSHPFASPVCGLPGNMPWPRSGNATVERIDVQTTAILRFPDTCPSWLHRYCTAQAIRLMMRCGAIMSGSGDGQMGEIFEVHWMKRGRHGPQDDQD